MLSFIFCYYILDGGNNIAAVGGPIKPVGGKRLKSRLLLKLQRTGSSQIEYTEV